MLQFVKDFIVNHFDSILSLVCAFVGAFAGGACVKITSKKNSENTTSINDVNTGGGDFAGGNICK